MAYSPLEDFVRDYVEAIGGAWDEVEPQVYDLLLPPAEMLAAQSKLEVEKQHLVRVAFEPEAVPEHPGSQLASFGTPLMDRLLNDALQRGRQARFYLLGLNLNPHDLAARLRRSFSLEPKGEFHLERTRVMHFAQALFWFQATLVSDQKEQVLLSAALDLHYGRQVRHLDKLLDRSRLAEQPALALPEARRMGLASGYLVARAEVLRTLATLAHARDRELRERLGRQVGRMARYYADLRRELDDQTTRARKGEETEPRQAARRQALEREEQLRIAELRQKNSLRVYLRLLNWAVIHQPKLLLRGGFAASGRSAAPLEVVWDPLVEAFEAIPCPACGKPTFALRSTPRRGLVCAACAIAT